MKMLEIADISDYLDRLANSSLVSEDVSAACTQAATMLRDMRGIIMSVDIPAETRIEKLREILTEHQEG